MNKKQHSTFATSDDLPGTSVIDTLSLPKVLCTVRVVQANFVFAFNALVICALLIDSQVKTVSVSLTDDFASA